MPVLLQESFFLPAGYDICPDFGVLPGRGQKVATGKKRAKKRI